MDTEDQHTAERASQLPQANIGIPFYNGKLLIRRMVDLAARKTELDPNALVTTD